MALGRLALPRIFILPGLRIPLVSLTHDARWAGILARRLWLPLVFFVAFSLMCVLAYQHLEGLRRQDARFWIINPHAIEYRRVRDTTKFFSIFVYFGVFAFQIWVAERLLITVSNRHSVEAFSGYGQVGRTVVDQLTRLGDSFRAHRNQREPLPRAPQG